MSMSAATDWPATEVTRWYYASRLATAWDIAPNVADSLTDYRTVASIPDDAHCYMLHGVAAGFIVKSDGELVGLFSAERGYGDQLVREAIAHGATRLDCFDGYLTRLYARHGFDIVKRERNWTPGGPDVVYMKLRGAYPWPNP